MTPGGRAVARTVATWAALCVLLLVVPRPLGVSVHPVLGAVALACVVVGREVLRTVVVAPTPYRGRRSPDEEIVPTDRTLAQYTQLLRLSGEDAAWRDRLHPLLVRLAGDTTDPVVTAVLARTDTAPGRADVAAAIERIANQ